MQLPHIDQIDWTAKTDTGVTVAFSRSPVTATQAKGYYLRFHYIRCLNAQRSEKTLLFQAILLEIQFPVSGFLILGLAV